MKNNFDDMQKSNMNIFDKYLCQITILEQFLYQSINMK